MFSATLCSEVRFSTREIFIGGLLGNKDIVRICIIPCTSPHPLPPGSSPFPEVAVQRPCRLSSKRAFAYMTETFILIYVLHMQVEIKKKQVKWSCFKNESF